MNIGIVNLYEIYNIKNAIFNPLSYPIGEDLGYPLIHLKDELNRIGVSINTLDILPIDSYDKIIYLDFSNDRKEELEMFQKMGKDLYLIILESEIIKPDNFDPSNHNYFKKIFTWNDDIVDGVKYFKLNLANKIPLNFRVDLGKKNRFCTMIAGNKTNTDRRELYSERAKAINWFEKNHPKEFDLYGFNWGKSNYTFPNSKLNKFSLFKKIFTSTHTVYKGTLNRKKDTLEQYRFSICYENARNINGYITEKIFDCFFAGVVPIYLGPNNIENIIPSSAFVDMRNFSDYHELYNYLKNMTNEEYLLYIDSIENYVNSDAIYPFAASSFTSTLIKEIL